MGMKDTGPGYWRAAQGKLELFSRNPNEPAPPFRLSGGWVALWVFLLLLGGLLAYLAVDSLITGDPLRTGEGKASAAVVLFLALFLMSVPIWHYPQVRKDWGRLSARMAVTSAGPDFYVMTTPISLAWEDVRGFRVENIRGRDQLIADLTSPYPNPEKKGPAETSSISGISCIEPHSSAYVLNSLLARPALRSGLGSLRSEADVNALMVNAVPEKRLP